MNLASDFLLGNLVLFLVFPKYRVCIFFLILYSLLISSVQNAPYYFISSWNAVLPRLMPRGHSFSHIPTHPHSVSDHKY